MSTYNKEELLESLADEAHEMFTNDGHSVEEAWILAQDYAEYRLEYGLYYEADYKGDD